MFTLLKFFVRRLIMMIITFILITATLYGVLMLAPPEARALLYLPRSDRFASYGLIKTIIKDHGLDDPYPVQYSRWLWNIVRGEWGWSPSLREDVWVALTRRTPVTAELALYSVLTLVPLGIIAGVWAGWRHGRWFDFGFRLIAFIATSIPTFVLALVLLAIFYAGLRWFPAGRIGLKMSTVVNSPAFTSYTGLLTVDGVLNGRWDITLDALRHMVLPVFTLSLAHWATLSRVTRAAIIEELDKEYIVAARARGVRMRRVIWLHALRNAILPAINSSALSLAYLLTLVFIVEIIFSIPGVSEPLVKSTSYTTGYIPDVATTMGFAVYAVLLVLPVMLLLDLLQALFDYRLREGVLA